MQARHLEINVAELWKFIKDYELADLTSQDEQKNLVRVICQDGLKQTSNLSSFDFNGFLVYIVQLAWLLYSRAPSNLSHLPASCSLSRMIEQLKFVTRKRGQSCAMYDEPDECYFGETEIIRQFNKTLRENPQYPLPEGYKKYHEKEIQFSYKLTPKLQLNEGYRVCYDLLCDVFAETLQ